MNACPDLLAALKQRQRDLELDHTAVKSRLAEVQDLIEMLERPQRRRRTPTERSQHVTGAAGQPEPQPDELFPADGQDTIGGTQ